MLLKDYLAKQPLRNQVAISLRLLLVLAFWGMIAAPPTMAQGYEVQYSDQWADDSNEGMLLAVGVGITEDSYTGDGDVHSTETELRSPSGRAVSAVSDYEYSYVRAEAFLWWNWEWGIWDVYTFHWRYTCDATRGGYYYYDPYDPWCAARYRYINGFSGYSLDWLNQGGDTLEYRRESARPLNVPEGRRCGYNICERDYNNSCAFGRRAIIRDDERTSGDCAEGYHRDFFIVGVRWLSYCQQLLQYPLSHDPCVY